MKSSKQFLLILTALVGLLVSSPAFGAAAGPTVVSPVYGGTGVSNPQQCTITIRTNNGVPYPLTMTLSGPTNITVPTSGTLSTGGGGGAGTVVGPVSAVDNHVAVFDGITGALIKDGGVVALTGTSSSAGAGDSGKVPLLNGTGVLDITFVAPTVTLARNRLNRGETALTDAATIATDCSLGNVFTVTVGGNRTMGAPTNLVAGATYIWKIKQASGGGDTLAWNSAFLFPGGTDPVLTTTANAVDIISGVSDGTSVFCSFIQDVK